MDEDKEKQLAQILREAEAVQAAGLKIPPVIESGCGCFRLEAFADEQEQARLDSIIERLRRADG